MLKFVSNACSGFTFFLVAVPSRSPLFGGGLATLFAHRALPAHYAARAACAPAAGAVERCGRGGGWLGFAAARHPARCCLGPAGATAGRVSGQYLHASDTRAAAPIGLDGVGAAALAAAADVVGVARGSAADER